MRECERDHLFGAPACLAERGKRFSLYLEGEKWCGRRWIGSEYTEANPEHFWWRGIGKIVDTVTGEEKVFVFTTWSDERGRERSFENFVFISDSWDFGPEKELSLVESRKPDFVDFLCEKIIEEIQKIKGDPVIPKVGLDKLSYKELVEKGFVFGERGQIHLGLAV